MLTKIKINLIFAVIALIIIFPVQASNFKELNPEPETVSNEFTSYDVIADDQPFSDNIEEAIKVIVTKIADNSIGSSCEYIPNAVGEMTSTKIVFWISITKCSSPKSFEEVLWFVTKDKTNTWHFKKEVSIGSNQEFIVNSIEIDDRYVLILGRSQFLNILNDDDQKRVYDDKTGNLHEAKSK